MLNQIHGAIKIFAGNSSKKLAQAICEQLDLELGKMDVGKFSDGETAVNIKESVRGCDVFIIQSTNTPVNDNLMELLLIIDACKRASAMRITAVIPYFGYARQDRKARARDPISAKLVADILQTAGADRVLTMDLHSSQLQGFFNIPVDNLMGMPVLAKHFKKVGVPTNLTIVSPDMGSVVRSRAMASKFDAPLAIIDKTPSYGERYGSNEYYRRRQGTQLLDVRRYDRYGRNNLPRRAGVNRQRRERSGSLLFARGAVGAGYRAARSKQAKQNNRTRYHRASRRKAYRQNRSGNYFRPICRSDRTRLH